MAARAVLFGFVLLCASCASLNGPLYLDFGGEENIAKVSDYFIDEISFDPAIYPYFEDSSIRRFKAKFSEHLCQQLDGPCEYTGDSMVDVHRGMNITESDFNRLVELLINAMNRADVPVSAQNRLLNKLAKMRPEVMGESH